MYLFLLYYKKSKTRALILLIFASCRRCSNCLPLFRLGNFISSDLIQSSASDKNTHCLHWRYFNPFIMDVSFYTYIISIGNVGDHSVTLKCPWKKLTEQWSLDLYQFHWLDSQRSKNQVIRHIINSWISTDCIWKHGTLAK